MNASSHTSEQADTAPRSYDELVERSPQGSVFTTSWWLDAVAPGGWRDHAVEPSGRLVAAWPTVVSARRGGDLHAGAPITPYLGPLLTAGEGAHRRSRELEAAGAPLDRLGDFAHLEARCSPDFDYWTPLHWHGFRQTTHYTWRLPDVSDTEAVFAGVRENVRREIRKARKHVEIEEGSLTEYFRVHEQTAARQDRLEEVRANRDLIERVEAAAAARGARTILLARDADGRLHSGAYFVHDRRWTYYLLGGSDPELRTSGAASLVLWAGIEHAAERGAGFDFEGSMLRPVERFVRSWGGVPAPYSLVRKTPSKRFAVERTVKRDGEAGDRVKRLLVLGAGPAQLGLLEAAQASGHYVVAVDRNPAAPGFRFASRRAIVSVEDEKAIDRLATAEHVDGLIAPGVDWPVAIAARIADRLGLRHPLSPATAVLATSKLKQRERFAQEGVPQPAYELCRGLEEAAPAAERVGYPCVVKPPDRQGQRGLSVVESPDRLSAAVERALDAARGDVVLVEELVDGPEVTVNGFSVDGEFHALTVTDRLIAELPAFGVALAHAWPCSADAEAAVEAASAAAAAIGITDGPTYTQVRLGASGPRVGELAARLGGGHDAELCEVALGVPRTAWRSRPRSARRSTRRRSSRSRAKAARA